MDSTGTTADSDATDTTADSDATGNFADFFSRLCSTFAMKSLICFVITPILTGPRWGNSPRWIRTASSKNCTAKRPHSQPPACFRELQGAGHFEAHSICCKNFVAAFIADSEGIGRLA